MRFIESGISLDGRKHKKKRNKQQTVDLHTGRDCVSPGVVVWRKVNVKFR